MLKKPYSGQKFRFQLDYLMEIIKFIEINKKMNKIENLAFNFGIGVPKAQAMIQYLKIIEVLDINLQLTTFGKMLLKLKNNEKFLYPLLYSKLCRGWENGGHFYFSRLVNNILYEVAFSSRNIITAEEAKEKMLTFKSEIQVQEKDIRSLTRQALSSLADEATGFGKMGIVKEIEKNSFYISYYEPHYLVAAYIIFDRWRKGDTVCKFNTIIDGDYHIGRLFFMCEDDVFAIFEKLKQEKLIAIEVTGGLNQITKNPKISINEILEEMVKNV